MTKAQDPDEKRWFRTRGGPPGPSRKALDADLAGFDPRPGQHMLVQAARDTADLADSARRRQDARMWLTASQRLAVLTKQLGVAGDNDAGDPTSDALAQLLGAGPQVGDAADS